jgi:hypothetical protein
MISHPQHFEISQFFIFLIVTSNSSQQVDYESPRSLVTGTEKQWALITSSKLLLRRQIR